MKKRISRILCTILCVALVASLLPTAAFAADAHTHTDAEGNTITFEPIGTIEQLTSLFHDGGNGYLTADITTSGRLDVEGDVNL